ncbi:hypothetical protein P7H19_10505 [Paenibacillus larvae]|nr:hypothetical protein [Paenibacillus larvae]MDT2236636.1 hypothetical protein [Paenibacillus larvae]
MTWTGTEWLKREKREELIRKYTELIDAMAANQNRLTESELAELDEYLTELERLERIHRGERNLLYFAWEYFRKRETRAIRATGIALSWKMWRMLRNFTKKSAMK